MKRRVCAGLVAFVFILAIAAACQRVGDKSGTAPNHLLDGASPATSALAFYAFDGNVVKLCYLFDNEGENRLLKELDNVPVQKVDDWSVDDAKYPIYGLEIGGMDGFSRFGAWTDGYWICADGSVYSFGYDFSQLTDSYAWSEPHEFSSMTVLPCAKWLVLDENGWNSKGMSKAVELTPTEAVELIIDSHDGDLLKAHVENNRDEDWTFGEAFHLDVSLKGEWYYVPMQPGNWGFTDIANILPAGSQTDRQYNLTMYGELPPGTYRIVVDGLSAEFMMD